MIFTPFTFEEAEEICEDFEDLVDTEFKAGSSVMLVSAVIISPFSDVDKDIFFERYNSGRKDLAGIYAGTDYDVMLIICEADDETNKSYTDIRTFADLRGIKYEFPVREAN